MKLIISPAVRALGIEARMALFEGAAVSNKSNPLEKRKKELLEKIKNREIPTDPILQGFRELYQVLGLAGEGFIPPAQHLISLAQRNGRLPNINTVVDCYNLVSAETGLSIGAHDTAFIKEEVAFRLTTGTEKYTPLGETSLLAVNPGEYAAMDLEKILCRLDVKQCNETRVTKETGAFIVYVQGNKNTPPEYIQEGLQKVCGLIQEICGGKYSFILAEEEPWDV